MGWEEGEFALRWLGFRPLSRLGTLLRLLFAFALALALALILGEE